MSPPSIESEYLYGFHDPGGEYVMFERDIRGWTLVSESVGIDTEDKSGRDFRYLSDRGLGVLVRINAGYNGVGTIPAEEHYQAFAQRCANFVQASTGVTNWIIGNEMNHPIEWPGADWDWEAHPPKPRSEETVGEKITPVRYAKCYKMVRNAIKALPGHEHDQVLVGAVAPWNALLSYPGNANGDWIVYFRTILKRLGSVQCDGFTLHTYTHGPEPEKIDSEQKMGEPFEKRHFQFRAYRDFLHAVPRAMRHLPAYITETDQDEPWRNENTAWVQRAYGEIDYWNQHNHQQIRALLLYRWQKNDRWYIDGKQGVIDDMRQAMSHRYRWKTDPPPLPPEPEPKEPSPEPFLAKIRFLDKRHPGIVGEKDTIRIKITNQGDRTWRHQGKYPVTAGYRWLQDKKIVEGEPELYTPLSEDILPGKSATLEMSVNYPQEPGSYVMVVDLMRTGKNWFAAAGSPAAKRKINVIAADEAEEDTTTPEETSPAQDSGETSAHGNDAHPKRGAEPREEESWLRDGFYDFYRRFGPSLFGRPSAGAKDLTNMNVHHSDNANPQYLRTGKNRVRPIGGGAYASAAHTAGPPASLTANEKIASAASFAAPVMVDLIDGLERHPTEAYETRSLDEITHIAVHHSATPASITPQRVAQYHVNSKRHQWPGIGYHYYIGPDGTVNQTQDLSTISYHVFNNNAYSVGICVAGDFIDVIPTPAQIDAAALLIAWLMLRLKIPIENILGHREFPDNHTSCPGRQWHKGYRWRDTLFARIEVILASVPPHEPGKPLDHYLLFWRHGTRWAREDWEGAVNYIDRFLPTSGFSVEDAKQAERVTIVGGTDGVSKRTEQELRAAGCDIDRVAGSTFAETKALLDKLAAEGTRFRHT